MEAVGIRLPPAAPTTKYRLPLEDSTMIGVMEDNGRLNGRMKFEGEGMKPKTLEELGTEKSFLYGTD
jgi:hypothetical protein